MAVDTIYGDGVFDAGSWTTASNAQGAPDGSSAVSGTTGNVGTWTLADLPGATELDTSSITFGVRCQYASGTSGQDQSLLVELLEGGTVLGSFNTGVLTKGGALANFTTTISRVTQRANVANYRVRLTHQSGSGMSGTVVLNVDAVWADVTYELRLKTLTATGVPGGEAFGQAAVTGGDPVITGTLPPLASGLLYSEFLATSNGTAPFTWSIIAGALPAGVSLDPVTGEFRGTSYTLGESAPFTVQVQDALGAVDSAVLTLTVAAADFSPYYEVLPYTGTGAATRTITTSVNLSGGGVVTILRRDSSGAYWLHSTGPGDLASNAAIGGGTTFADGSFSMDSTLATNANVNGATYVAIVLAKVAGAVEPITWTGNGSSPRQIAHSLGVAPALALQNALTGVGYHRELGPTTIFSEFMGAPNTAYFNSTNPDASNLTVGSNYNAISTVYRFVLIAEALNGLPFCKIGSYTGNGSVTPFGVGAGFLPSLYISQADVRSGGSGELEDKLITAPVLQAGGNWTGNDEVLQETGSTDAWGAFDLFADGAADDQYVGSTRLRVNDNGREIFYVAFASEVDAEGLLVAPSIASGAAFGAHTLTLGAENEQNLWPPSIASGQAMGQPALTGGQWTLLVEGLPSAEAFGDMQIRIVQRLEQTAGIASAEAFGSGGEVQGGDITITGALPLYAAKDLPFRSDALAATGGVKPYTWSFQSGAPPGLSIDGATGAITGTPTTNGSYPAIVVRCTGNDSQFDEVTLAMTVRTVTPQDLIEVVTFAGVDQPTADAIGSLDLSHGGYVMQFVWAFGFGFSESHYASVDGSAVDGNVGTVTYGNPAGAEFTSAGFRPEFALEAANFYTFVLVRKAAGLVDVVKYSAPASTDEHPVSHGLGAVPALLWNTIDPRETEITDLWFPGLPADTTFVYGGGPYTAPSSTQFFVNNGGAPVAREGYCVLIAGTAGVDAIVATGSYTGSTTVPVDVVAGFQPRLLFINDTTGSLSYPRYEWEKAHSPGMKGASAAVRAAWQAADPGSLFGINDGRDVWTSSFDTPRHSLSSAALILNDDGFTVGPNTDLSAASTTHYWIAFNDAPHWTLVQDAAIDPAEAFGTATLGSLAYLTATGIPSAAAFGAASIASDTSQMLEATGVGSSEALGTPALAPGTAPLVANAVASGEAFGGASVVPGEASLSAPNIVSAQAFGTASLAPGPAALLASGIASTAAFGAAVVGTGASELLAAGITSAEAFGTATARTTLYAAGVASTSALGAPTLAPGPVTLASAGIASAGAFGAPSITAGVTLRPAGLASAEAFGAATATPGAASLMGVAIGSAEAFGAASLQPTQILSASGIASGAGFGLAVLSSGGVTLQPAGIAGATAFGLAGLQVRVALLAAGIPTALDFGAYQVSTGGVLLQPLGLASAEAFGLASFAGGSRLPPVLGAPRPRDGVKGAERPYSDIAAERTDDGTLIAVRPRHVTSGAR